MNIGIFILVVVGVLIVLCAIVLMIAWCNDPYNPYRSLDMKCQKCGGSYTIISFFGRDTNYRREYECNKCGDIIYKYGCLKKDETEIIADKILKCTIKERSNKSLEELKKKVKGNE